MRKAYLDNIRWFTVVLVVIYHVFYMYNGEGLQGTLGKITNLEVQYFDVYQYIVYPWFMVLLFMVSGISSRLYLEKHTDREFRKSRTTKLLVPTTIGLFAFQFIQGYINAQLSNAGSIPAPPVVKFLIYSISGIGVLWYIQMLWLFSMVLLLIRKMEKGRLLSLGEKTNLLILLLFTPVFYLAGQVGNTPIICCYRFGLYFVAFLFGYYVLSHEKVVQILKKWWAPFCLASVILCVWFCIKYFGLNYADKPVYLTPLFLVYGYIGSLSMLGLFARFFDRETPFTRWMGGRSFGLYIFHYLGISSVALFLAKPEILPPAVIYPLSLVAGFVAGYGLNAILSRIPFWRWAVLGITAKKR
ncbi:MAG: acyltransferase [Lachnospiraceae bacterium]|nr:acyltransferase [Lachnospiraceae bacterium]